MELPPFVREYVQGINDSKEQGTILEYVRDIKTFLTFLVSVNPSYEGTKLRDIPFSVLEQLAPEDIDEYMAYLTYYKVNGHEYRNGRTTKARKLSSLSGMYKFFIKRKKLVNNPIDAVERPNINRKNIARLDSKESKRLIEDVESGNSLSRKQADFHGKTKYRDKAILITFLYTGLRLSELVGLNHSDVLFGNDASSFKVIRKGGDEDTVYFGDEVKKALKDYIEFERQALLSRSKEDVPESESALFVSLQRRRISLRAVQVLVKKYSEQSKDIHKNISPHKCRSTFGTALYEETGDLYLVAEILGHKSVDTTRRHYAMMGDDRKKLASRINIYENS